MLPQEEFVEIHALRKRGWSIAAIARHLGRDRKTIRAHLKGKRRAGQRRSAATDRFEEFAVRAPAPARRPPSLGDRAL